MITATGHELSKALAARELLAIFVFDQFIEDSVKKITFLGQNRGLTNYFLYTRIGVFGLISRVGKS
jgi:hypothetical protein